MGKAWVAVLAVLVSACLVPTDEFIREREAEQAARRQRRVEELNQRTVGHNVHDLIPDLGAPNKVIPNGKTSIYEWDYVGATRTAISGSVFGSGGFASGGLNSSSWTDGCRLLLEVDGDDMVVHANGSC